LARERKIPIEHELRGKSFRWDGFDGDFLWPEIVPEEAAPSAKCGGCATAAKRFCCREMLKKRWNAKFFQRERERERERAVRKKCIPTC